MDRGLAVAAGKGWYLILVTYQPLARLFSRHLPPLKRFTLERLRRFTVRIVTATNLMGS